MKTKTWKLGEYCRGGIITVQIHSDKIHIIGKDWDFTTGSRKSSNQSNAKEFTRLTVPIAGKVSSLQYAEMMEFLEDLTSYHYAEQVRDWIIEKAG